MKRVFKFGGSSVKDQHAMRQCARVVESTPDLSIVVISATYNTTNDLERAANFAKSGSKTESHKVFNSIVDRHVALAKDLEVYLNIENEFKNIIKEGEAILNGVSILLDLTPRAMDLIYSLGERLSSLILATFLKNSLKEKRNVELVDARDVIKTDRSFMKANPLIDKIKCNADEKLMPLINQGSLIVTQGFIGSTQDGVTTTLGREGSDFSASLLAEAIDADELIIWTDVDGIYSADPRIVPNAKRIDHLHYDQAALMAKSGAKVLFHNTLGPAIRKQILVKVQSTFAPEKGFTLINNFRAGANNNMSAKSINLMNNRTILRIENKGEQSKRLFLSNILDLFARLDINYNIIDDFDNEIAFLIDTKVVSTLQKEFNIFESDHDYKYNVNFQTELSKITIFASGINSDSEESKILVNKVFSKLVEIKESPIYVEIKKDVLSLVVLESVAKNIVEKLHSLIF